MKWHVHASPYILMTTDFEVPPKTSCNSRSIFAKPQKTKKRQITEIDIRLNHASDLHHHRLLDARTPI